MIPRVSRTVDSRRPIKPARAPATTRRRLCDLCDGEDFQLIGRHDRRGQPLDTVVCRTCGLVSHARIPDDEELAEYYRERYRRDYHGQAEPSPHRVVHEWRRCRDLVEKKLAPDLRPTDRIIEVGSGLGCTVKHLELAGYDARGIDPGEAFVRYSREVLRANTARGSLQDLPRVASYDVVLLFHVLEHLNAPKEALRRLGKVLRPDGRLYVEVPNFGAPHAAPGRLFHRAHIYNFTATTLRMLGEGAGFDVRVLSGADEKHLLVAMRKSSRNVVEVDPRGYRDSMDALGRYNVWTYHARAHYLSRAARRAWNRVWCRWNAVGKVESIRREIADRKGGSRRWERASESCTV